MPLRGNWIPFNETNVRLYAPENKGAYELANRFSDGVIRTIYIGSSEESLRTRLLQHLSYLEPNIGIKRHAQFFRYQVSSDPKRLEMLLILEFKLMNGNRLPLFNRKFP